MKVDGLMMTQMSFAVLSPAEFEIARGLISELSDYAGYDDWLDSRYGRYMGYSLGGADAELVDVNLAPFLDWCVVHKLRPSESALDAFALESVSRREIRSVA